MTVSRRDGDRSASDALLELPLAHGAIAQLGEHLHGMQKVRGSSPRRSTTLAKRPRIGVPSAPDMAYLTDHIGRSSADLALTGVAGF